MSEAEIKATLRAWVAKTSGAAVDSFTDQTPIFGKGLLKSVHILDLILLIEETSDREIDVEQLGPTSFKDIETIYATFFGAASCGGNSTLASGGRDYASATRGEGVA